MKKQLIIVTLLTAALLPACKNNISKEDSFIPFTLTDMIGREVHIDHEVNRLLLQYKNSMIFQLNGQFKLRAK